MNDSHKMFVSAALGAMLSSWLINISGCNVKDDRTVINNDRGVIIINSALNLDLPASKEICGHNIRQNHNPTR
jgi:hypothetical protein